MIISISILQYCVMMYSLSMMMMCEATIFFSTMLWPFDVDLFTLMMMILIPTVLRTLKLRMVFDMTPDDDIPHTVLSIGNCDMILFLTIEELEIWKLPHMMAIVMMVPLFLCDGNYYGY